MKWHRGFALYIRRLRQPVLFPPKAQPTLPLLDEINILDATLPAQNGNNNQANNRNGDHKRERGGVAEIHYVSTLQANASLSVLRRMFAQAARASSRAIGVLRFRRGDRAQHWDLSAHPLAAQHQRGTR
jgi:hypothetical protein